ncbi:MAG TPA: Ldh family oxidoreductase [Candidatus Binatia bacterium]|jgi:LDH2 family malate/lactate/ureidoglycolate dehydrogenase
MTQSPSTAGRFHAPELEAFVTRALTAVGLPMSDAEPVARLMILADLRGADGHGIFRLPQYVRRIKAGGMNLRPNIRAVRETEATALIDGDNGMGHLVMRFAARAAIEKAERAGVGWVGVRQGNHSGPAALYAMMPLERDMIGIYIAVGNANHLPPWGGVELLLSTNPIACAIPALEEPPLVLDMATTVAAYGKVKIKAQRGEPLPEGWMIDPHGRSLTDPKRAGEGFLLPIGGYKGYGLALIFGLLAGTLNGAAFGRNVIDFNKDDRTPTNTGQLIIALDIARFSPVESFKRGVDQIIREMRNSKKMPGVERIQVPGEQSHATWRERTALGIPLNDALLNDLERVAGELGVEKLGRTAG